MLISTYHFLGGVLSHQQQRPHPAAPLACAPPHAVLHVRTPCPGLELQLAHNVPAGAVAYVNDQLFLHSVGCADGVPAPGAVTLHLYCPPVGCNPLNAVACSTFSVSSASGRLRSIEV